MNKIAIDIVLLPEKEMASKLITINRELLKTNENRIILGNVINQPHISLCMGGVHKNELPQIIKVIDELSNDFSQINLQGELSTQTASGDEKIVWLKIRKDNNIQKLHQAVMKSMWKRLHYDIEKYMFVNSNDIEEKTITWVKRYVNMYENVSLFSPHITIGVGDTEHSESFHFSSSEIAIFQLGNYCTCAELIYKTSLTGHSFQL